MLFLGKKRELVLLCEQGLSRLSEVVDEHHDSFMAMSIALAAIFVVREICPMLLHLFLRVVSRATSITIWVDDH
jgi:hypothetical protein